MKSQPQLWTGHLCVCVLGRLHSRVFNAIAVFAFWMAFLLGLGGGGIRAQGTTEVDLMDVVHSVTLSGGMLSQGDTAFLTLILGSGSMPVEDALGLRLDLVIASEAVLPGSELAIDTSGSWLLDGALDRLVTVDEANRVVHIELLRSDDLPQSGHGFVLRLPLVSAYDDVTASSLLDGYGGVVVIEDIDFKMGQPMETPDESAVAAGASSGQVGQCFPNPTNGLLHVPVAEGDRIWLLHGDKRAAVPSQSEEGYQQVDLREAPQGLNYLEVLHKNGSRSYHTVIRL